MTRRGFITKVAAGSITTAITPTALAQVKGARPHAASSHWKVINPRARVPVSLIIDDSTCLVNLNRFAMPQFNEAHAGRNPSYHRKWREWPVEIPDAFVRKFAEWSALAGVKGKYSVVPFPACVGRLDRELPGWSRTELRDSIATVRQHIMPNWDIHPEMITHTRVIDLKTGHPYPDYNLRFMENWEWTAGRSVDELASYMAYALSILKEAGLPCAGITTPGGFGNQVLPQLAQASLQSVRSTFGTAVPHYFRHVYDTGEQSVMPRVEYAAGLDGPNPQCVVSIIGCTGDWTGGWDCTTPDGADRFITQDLSAGRMVEVISRGEPACMVCHWTGVYWNGQELGLKIFQEVVRRLHSRFQNIVWMKLSEIAEYWAAKELTRLHEEGGKLTLQAPFACKDFTITSTLPPKSAPMLESGSDAVQLRGVASEKELAAGTWCKIANGYVYCFDLRAGKSQLRIG